MDKAVRVLLHRAEDTLRLGEAFGRRIVSDTVIGLIGPLGAGKTTFVRGLSEGLGIAEGFVVSSPTFTILQIYPCRSMELWHLDLYRISGPEDLDSTGFRDGFGGPRVLVVEWADREPTALPPDHILVALDYTEGGREAVIRASGEANGRIVEAVTEAFGSERGPAAC